MEPNRWTLAMVPVVPHFRSTGVPRLAIAGTLPPLSVGAAIEACRFVFCSRGSATREPPATEATY